MNTVRRGAGAALLLVFLLAGCGPDSRPGVEYAFEHSGWTMGTSFSIKAPALPEALEADALKSEIDGLLLEINGEMSTYREDSALSKLNSDKTTESLAVSESLFTVLNEAQKISQLSGGAFDITVGPLVNLWGFGPDKIISEPPSSETIARKLRHTGYANLILDASRPAVQKLDPELYLDLSALAKGYGVDQVADLLETRGIKDYLVEIGGELRLKGVKSDQQKWRIAVEKPTAEMRMVQKIMPLTNIAIATSGDYRNYFEKDGVRYSHTIDPRTGKPITHKLASVTVLSHTAMEADALATALMVLGPDEGYGLAEKLNLAAFFIIKSEEGFIEKSSSNFLDLTR